MAAHRPRDVRASREDISLCAAWAGLIGVAGSPEKENEGRRHRGPRGNTMELYTTPALSTQCETLLAGYREDTGLGVPAWEPSRAELLAAIQGSKEALKGKIESVAIEVNLLRADLRKVSN
ncbi:hypothetical protein NDU88_007145 [Pleurodeles waltl]|uniref:Uncharacterized protein n=1 Tax=Pleurodeles waltl TaxID=8319 RepID=A0AAV7PNZ3_PLEWA|nr:hypothetical protein NDU88_007145 [Pleurodeles waltl]